MRRTLDGGTMIAHANEVRVCAIADMPNLEMRNLIAFSLGHGVPKLRNSVPKRSQGGCRPRFIGELVRPMRSKRLYVTHIAKQILKDKDVMHAAVGLLRNMTLQSGKAYLTQGIEPAKGGRAQMLDGTAWVWIASCAKSSWEVCVVKSHAGLMTLHSDFQSVKCRAVLNMSVAIEPVLLDVCAQWLFRASLH